MAKFMSDAFADSALNYLKNNAQRQIICSAQPANFAGVAAVSLADVAVDSSDFTVADGDTSGRKVTVAQQANMPIDSSGTATHVVYVNDTSSLLIYGTTCTSQALTAGGTVTVPAHDIEIADPS